VDEDCERNIEALLRQRDRALERLVDTRIAAQKVIAAYDAALPMQPWMVNVKEQIDALRKIVNP